MMSTNQDELDELAEGLAKHLYLKLKRAGDDSFLDVIANRLINTKWSELADYDRAKFVQVARSMLDFLT